MAHTVPIAFIVPVAVGLAVSLAVRQSNTDCFAGDARADGDSVADGNGHGESHAVSDALRRVNSHAVGVAVDIGNELGHGHGDSNAVWFAFDDGDTHCDGDSHTYSNGNVNAIANADKCRHGFALAYRDGTVNINCKCDVDRKSAAHRDIDFDVAYDRLRNAVGDCVSVAHERDSFAFVERKSDV